MLLLVALLFVIIAAILQSATVERFNVGNQMTKDGNSWVYSRDSWVSPTKDTTIARYHNLNEVGSPIANNNMSVSFWINIRSMHSNWRNIFRFAYEPDLQYTPTGRAENVPYSQNENISRRPAVFINPNMSRIHITHSSTRDWNNWFDVDIPKFCHVCLVWSYNPNPYEVRCTVYIDGKYRTHYSYGADLLQPDQDATIRLCDRYYGDGGYSIRAFTIHKKALSANEVSSLYNTQYRQIGKPWQCVPGFNAPMRKNQNEDVECMSLNNRDCLWGGDCNTTLNNTAIDQVRPLTCGTHHRDVWGGTGYNNVGHWCYQVRNRI